MKTAVRYYSRSGNTKKLADAAAAAVSAKAADVSNDLSERVDVLFLANSLYAGKYDPAVGAFLERNADKIGTVANICSSASGRSTFAGICQLAHNLGISVFEEQFVCLGHFLFLHRDRPNEKDLEGAAAFASAVLRKLGD